MGSIKKVRKIINIGVMAIYLLYSVYLTGRLVSAKLDVQSILPEIAIIIGVLSIILVVINFEDFLLQFKLFRKSHWVLLIFMTLVLLGISIYWQDNWFGVICTVTGVLCVIQANRGSKWTYFWGGISVLFYYVIAYRSGYAGDFVLNALFYVPIQVIGLYMWSKNYKNREDEVIKRKFKGIYGHIMVAVGVVMITYLVGEIMPYINEFLGMKANPRPYIDAFTTTASLFAQVLMIMRYKEQWSLWILINIFSIVMWIVLGDYIVATMWGVYLINSISGYLEWGRD